MQGKSTKMLLSYLLIISLAVVQFAECHDDSCKGALSRCLEALAPEGTGTLPTSQEQINSLCKAYKAGNECVESWSKRCLPEERQKSAKLQRQGVMLLMAMLCDDQYFRRGYLNHTTCYKSVSKDWNRCLENLKWAGTDDGTHSNDIYRNQVNICCSRYAFNRCISIAAKAKCNRDGAVMLRRISETLSVDSVRMAHCEAIDTKVCHSNSNRCLCSLFILISNIAVVLYRSTK